MTELIRIILPDDLPPERRARVSRGMAIDLSRAGAPARVPDSAASSGERGVLADIGQVVIDALGSTAAGAVIDVLKAWLVRERKLRVAIRLPDGTSIEIDAANVGTAAVQTTLEAALAARR